MEKDSFIVHRELNLRPISALRDYLWKDESYESEFHSVFTFDELSKDLLPELIAMKEVSNNFLKVKDQVNRLNEDLDVVILRLNEEMWKNVDAYKEEKMADVNKRLVEKRGGRFHI